MKKLLLALGALMMSQTAQAENFHNFTMKNIKGEDVNFESYKGKVVMVVNTASLCGFTKQYGDLQKTYDKYKDQGFVILAFPANNFGDQEPGSNKEIKEFCEVNFGITLPLMEKISVVGDDAHPLYKWLQDEAGFTGKVRWNFHKFIVGKDGSFKNWYSSITNPTSSRVEKAIEKALAE